MKTTQARLTFGLAIICGALLCGWVITRALAADAPAAKQTSDEELQRLLTARLDSATKSLQSARVKLNKGAGTLEAVYQAAQRVLDAELELSTKADDRVTVLIKHVALMRDFEQDTAKKIERGMLAVGDDETPRCWRLTAEVELLRAKRAATPPK